MLKDNTLVMVKATHALAVIVDECVECHTCDNPKIKIRYPNGFTDIVNCDAVTSINSVISLSNIIDAIEYKISNDIKDKDISFLQIHKVCMYLMPIMKIVKNEVFLNIDRINHNRPENIPYFKVGSNLNELVIGDKVCAIYSIDDSSGNNKLCEASIPMEVMDCRRTKEAVKSAFEKIINDDLATKLSIKAKELNTLENTITSWVKQHPTYKNMSRDDISKMLNFKKQEMVK